MGDAMTLRHLTIFLRVCDLGNMTAASQELHIAQPSVSQAIGEMERHYNVKLFERLGRRLFLTEAGRKLETYARHIVHLSREAETAMWLLEEQGRLRIGASVTVGTHVLPQILSAFSLHYPKVGLQSAVHNTKIIEEMLLVDQLDIALVEGNLHTKDLAEWPFLEDELVVVCSPEHPFAHKKEIEAAELSGAEWILREEGSGTRELFDSVMGQQGLSWQAAGVYNNAEAIKEAVAVGLGVSVISKRAVAREIAKGELVQVAVKNLSFLRQFRMVYHKNKYISPIMEQFIQVVRNEEKWKQKQ